MNDIVQQETAETALGDMTQHVADGAKPWVVPEALKKQLLEAFRPDFTDEITSPEEYRRWRPRLAKLFRRVGVQAAENAKDRRGNPPQPGDVGWDDLMAAVVFVRMAYCPDDEEIPSNDQFAHAPLGKICRKVAFAQGKVDRELLVAVLTRPQRLLAARWEPNPFAKIALDRAYEDLDRAAYPWKVSNNQKWLWEQFDEDFDKIITCQEQYLTWRNRLLTLFTHSGHLAALLEASQHNIDHTPGEIRQQYLAVALQVVKVALCRIKHPDGKACGLAPVLKESELGPAKAAMIALGIHHHSNS